jgi:hypothetical protein
MNPGINAGHKVEELEPPKKPGASFPREHSRKVSRGAASSHREQPGVDEHGNYYISIAIGPGVGGKSKSSLGPCGAELGSHLDG